MVRGLLLIGCGKMGGALLTGWLTAGLVDRVVVLEPSADALPGDALPANALLDDKRVVHATAPADLPDGFVPEVVVLAVKPQVMDDVMAVCRDVAGPDTCFLSIAAGRPLAWFAERLGDGAPMVRAMPNTPAAIGQGVTVLVANGRVTASQAEACERLMAAVGSVERLDDEALMDAVTAVSGGGPAYTFLLIEALADAGAAAGLPPDLAMRLARGTVVGAGALAASSPQDAATLRRNVTSPGGTTEAALAVLMAEDGVSTLVDRAVAAAVARSRALAG